MIGVDDMGAASRHTALFRRPAVVRTCAAAIVAVAVAIGLTGCAGPMGAQPGGDAGPAVSTAPTTSPTSAPAPTSAPSSKQAPTSAASGPCAGYTGAYATAGEGVKSLDLFADCSVTDSTGQHYNAIDVAQGAPAGSIPSESDETPMVPGSLTITLEETIHGTANVYALFPAGVKVGFPGEGDAGDPYSGNVSRDRMISMSGGPYVNVEYDVVAPLMLVRR